MKKKNLKLGKLTLKKSNVASLAQRRQIMGGSNGPGCNSDIECTVTCVQNTCTATPDPGPPPSASQQFTQCPQTQGFSCGPACNPTQENCATSPGDFLCEVGGFGGLA